MIPDPPIDHRMIHISRPVALKIRKNIFTEFGAASSQTIEHAILNQCLKQKAFIFSNLCDFKVVDNLEKRAD